MKLRTLFAAALIFPLVTFGGTLSGGGVANVQDVPMMTDAGIEAFVNELGTSQTYQCCWTYYMGRWWCVPC